MHNELNGSGPDWKIEGNYNILIGCAGVATAASLATAANIINGDYNQIIGGVYDDLEIGSGASNNISTGAKMSGGTVSDNGTDSTFLDRPEEHTSELQSLMRISYAVFCLNKK